MKRILLIFGMVLLTMTGIRAQQRVKIHTTMGDIAVVYSTLKPSVASETV